jgi:hypothetical protein
MKKNNKQVYAEVIGMRHHELNIYILSVSRDLEICDLKFRFY